MIEPTFSLPSSIEAERKHLLSQRKKAYSLIFLMIMLAQTSYIGALEGWSLYTELEEIQQEPLRVDSPAVCAATSRSSGTAIHVDVTEGDDAYPGTTNCPKASLGAAVTLATSEAASNPEIVLHAGLYHENVSVNNLDNLLIRAADGDRVVFDGTRSITDDLGGVWGTADSDGIQEVTLTEDGWQLFLAYEEQVPARWPNAGFDDETVFNRSYWAEGTLTNSNNAYTKGWLTDAGPEAGVHTGLNETVNATGLDPVGAIAVMNLGSFQSNSRIITDWNPNNGTFAYDGDGVDWKTKHHAYFLEGKRELIDVDGEWWYNNTNNRLHYKTPSGQDANNLDLRVKVQPFAISVDGSDGVTLQGIDFFGTTVNFNNCDGCSFTNATLEYPSTSKRGLGIAGESEDDRWMTRFYRSTNSFVDRVSITNTDGGAIEFQGSAGQSHNNTVNNSYFHAIDWSAADQKGLMVTIYEGGRDMYFTNNTVHLTGASSVLSIGDAPKVFYNEVWDVGHLQTDGAVVQVMQAEAPGSEIAYNWIHDVIKYGARFDAPIGEAGEGRNGTMHHNVIWNAAGGLMVKGDYHNIHNNTVFNSSGKNDMIILTDNGVNNGNSTIHQNAADKMADHRSDSWSLYPLPAGTYWNNWNGYVNTTGSVWNQLVDPANGDFRPKTNSHLDNMSAGAYDAGVSNPWTAGISWTYSTPDAPIVGCMLDYADNYDADATLSDGSCLFSSYTPPSTLDLRLNLDPTNSSSYSGSGTNFADLSGYNNNGTISGATWDGTRHRFELDGCTGSSAPYTCDDIQISNSQSLRPGPTDEDLAIELNQGSTTQYLTAPANAAGYSLGSLTTSFTVAAWVKPTDCLDGSADNFLRRETSFAFGCANGEWSYALASGSSWYNNGWIDTDVKAEDDVWAHVAYTRASSTTGVKMFINGELAYSASTYEGNLAGSNEQVLIVGTMINNFAAAKWEGLVDDLRIYTSDRSSTINDDMNEYPNVSDANLNAFFDFNQGRHNDTVTSVPNMATGTGASSASLTSVTGSPTVNRVWDVSTVGSDTVLTFERTVLTASGGWKVPSGVSTADALVVGGGGGGGYNTGGGGGGGGVGFYNSTALTAGSAVVVVVGQGGQGSTTNTADGANGTLSQLGTTVVGGGGGGATWTSSGADGVDAPTGSPAFIQNGSGGGASNANGVGGTGATDGGDGTNDAGGGGGGAGEDGSDAPSSNNGGDGGDGLNSNITGSSVMYGSGAGGGSWNSYGDGGAGAGNGGTTTAATHGTTNRGGGGGGGGGNSNDGANGGSGVVIVRYESVREHDWTVEVWFNASSQHTANTQTIFGTFATGGQAEHNRYSARLLNNNSVRLDYRTSVWTVYSVTTQPLDDDRWYHLAAVFRDDTNLSLYLDGQFVGDTSVSGSLLVSPNDLFIGSYSNAAGGQYSQGFDGQIGLTRIYGGAPNATIINQIYNAGKGVYSNTTNLSYAQSSSTMLLDQAYSFPLTVTNGEVTTSYSLTGTLPSGMNFESSNGTIWGTPTVAMTSTTYTVTANNSAGSYSTSISLTSQHVAPYDLVYAPENMTLEKGTAMTTNTPSVNGGTVTSWEISPSVPTGLSFSTSTGAISGTPTVLQTTATTYTIWANNSGGSASANINITINDVAPVVSYSTAEITGTKNVAISPHVGPTTSGGAITSWEISPDPGSAFHFNTGNGYISGTPSTLLTRTQYTIWANNSGGSSVAYVNVTINDAVPNSLGYTPENMTLEKGTTMTTNTPSVSGGTVTSWEISPSLPSGLAFSTSTGAISGTPSVLQTTATTYTIWANNSGGSASAQVNITINDQVASISYSSPVEIFNNRALSSTITPSVSGGAVTSWEITPSLPTGLTFGTTNGSIWGTPENVTSNATYTIYANNSGGSASTTLTLSINWTLTPSAGGAYITRNASIGTDITWEWDYEPLEAQNLSLVTGEWNTCALDSNQNVFCWGRNGNGQIGNGQTGTAACGTSGHKCKDIPTATNDLGSDVISLAFGHQHACGLLDTGAVKCWGRNNNGQLGSGGGDEDTPQSINLGSGRTATSIHAGGYYTCAILDDESVKCWGQNTNGQLGIGSTSNTNTPTTINTLGSGRTAVSLATGFNAVCALLDDGSVKCWGDDSQGQLGNGGTNADLSSPPSSAINLGSGRTAKAITGGEYHFCAILDDDSIKCWGDGTDGKLGTGSTADKNTPAATSGSFSSGRYAVLIDAGYDHTCVVLDNGGITCWGSDGDGQLGNGATAGTKTSLQSSTVSLGTGRTAISLSAGGTHTCAQLDNGQLKCWGNRADGQVGDNGGFNSPSDRTSPSTVSNNNHGGNTYQNTGQMPSAAVSGATCAVSPALPTGLSLTSGTCAITGTPTVTAINATYTVWANISGTSFSGQVWIEVGLNTPILSFSPTSYLFVDGVTITEVTPTNTGGEISGFEISPALPTGLAIGSTNGTIWGTPTAASSQTTYTIWGNNSAGSSSTTITIKVETSPTSLAYDTENMTLTKGLAMTTNTATVGGGTPTSWEISPSLPSGLSFSSTTGEISGTPTVLQTTAVTYTVWANNTAGSVNTSLNITVVDELPTIAYSPADLTLTNNTASSDLPLVPTITGSGEITSWEINASLPTGISFGNANGTLYGTATQLWTITAYKVWANNSGGSVEVFFNLTVNDQLPGLSYSVENLTLTKGQSSSSLPLNATLTGPGTITSWAISSTLPSGLSFGTSNGTIWGTPTSMMTFKSYTIWANNSGGSSSATVNITVNYPPDISYSPDWFVLTNNTAMSSTATPTNVGGATLSGIIDSSGNVGGYTSTAIDSFGYKHISYNDRGNGDLKYATDKTGTWVTTSVDTSGSVGKFTSIAIDSNDAIHISYYDSTNADLKYATCSSGCTTASNWDIVSVDTSGSVGVTTSIATNSNDAIHISYYDSTNADLKYATCSSGCTTASNWDNVSIDTTGNVGSDTSIAIDSNDAIHISYNAGTNADLKYATCSSGCTTASNWDINSVDTTGNVGYYTSIAIGSDDSVHISYWDDSNSDLKYATCSSGCTSSGNWGGDSVDTTGNVGLYTSIAVDSKDALYISYWDYSNSDLKYATCSTYCYKGTSWSNVSVDTTGSIGWETSIAIDSNDAVHISYYDSTNEDLKYFGFDSSSNIFGYSVSPALPTGLSFNISTGEISGTPTELSTNTTYTITARNNGGVNTTTITIEVVDQLPTLSYPLENLILTKGQASTDLPLNATLTGPGTITSWEINATLPSGLNFGTSNGTIWGTPTELWTQTSYMVWANNSGGSSVAYLNITINDVSPNTVVYSPENMSLNNNTAMTTNTPTAGGGPVTSWAISPALPNGLSFGSTNGSIWGTPTIEQSSTTYTVWANNSGGSASAQVNITINVQVPNALGYTPENMTLEKGTTMTTNTPSVSGGAVTSWEISPALPTGLSFSTSTGAISGTPTVLQTIATTYTIWANNSGGSASANINITINDEAPDISYSPDWFVLTNNTAMSSTTPTNSGGAIPSAVIASANNPGYQTSIAVDSYGYKHISWSGNSGYLKYATDASGSWVGQIVDTSSATGYYSSIAIDSNGGVHISYFDNSNGDLKYATCSSACTTASNWNYVSVDTSGDVGYNTSIAIDSNDGVHISYFDETNDDLKYATCSSSCTTASNWDKVSVDTTGHVGLFNSIAIDSNDGVHISYYDDTNYDLKYATCSSSCTTASNWDKVAIDTTGFVGSFTSIAIDSNDGVHVSYWAFTPGLKYASCSSSCTTASNWDKVGIDTEPERHTSIAIDSNDGVHISYHDYTNHDLKYATCSSGCTTASNWNYETVHSIGQTGYYTSIAIDANDVIHISYYDDTNNKIKYLALDSSSNTLGYSISPDLPEGLTLDPISGEISGTPTELSTNTTYTITARNSGGVNTTTITILVNDQVPNALGYTPENMTLSKGTAMTTNTPSVSGGAVTSWEISPALPSGLSFGTSNGTIWGIPTVLQTTATTYTIWANNSGGSTSATVNITINDQAPGPFEYNPENNTLTNNTYVHLEPDFVNITTGNGSTWSTTPAGYQLTTVSWGGPCLNHTYNGTIYVSYNAKLHGYGIANNTLWLINNTIQSVGCETWSTPFATTYSKGLSHTYGTSLYFTGKDGSDRNLYGYGMENGTIWVESTADPGVWSMLVDDVMYFIGETGNSGYELHGHNLSNGTTWMLDDIDSGSGSITGPALANNWPVLVESTFVFGAVFNNGSTYNRETWAHNISNGTSWQLSTMDGTTFNAPVIGDVVYFTQTISSNQWLYAYNASNETFWQVSTDEFRYPFEIDGILYGYWEYGYYPYNSQLRAHNPSNGTTWVVSTPGLLDPLNMGGTLYYAGSLTGTSNVKLWAYEPTNSTGWKVSDLTIPYSYDRVFIALGDVIYFTASNATTSGLWAHSSSNHSTWFVSNPFSSISATAVAVVNGTLYLGNSGMAGHQPTSINYQTNTGGAVTSWAINASLPSGLSFSTTNGSIYGTPTELWTQTAYMVWANNSGGSSVAYLNITVVDELPTIAYSPADLTLTNNTASSDFPLAPTITGSGEITSWEINASLPSGLTFGTSNGTIWGTPTELWTQTAYMVWANNSGGSSVAYLNITVVDELPTLSYSPANLTLTNNTASSDFPLAPTITGSGEITSWEINASLPSGLTFGTSNGTIWGTPTELWTQTAYMVWANNSGGSSVAYLNITVVDELPTLSYSPANLTLTNNTASSDFPLAPTITGSGEITSWEINASLPSGLTFGTSNGTIWGTPTELWNTTAYMVWANNSGGSSVAYLNITVVDELPTLSYSPANLTLTNNTASSDLPLVPTITGSGEITSWEINASLPSGLTFGTSNGTIWGTPTELWTQTSYMVWANNSGGSSVAYLNITVVDELPTIAYSPADLTLTNNTASSDLPLVPTITGSGEITSWAINASLPSGLTFETSNGTIWGTPTELWTQTAYLVWANNSGGSAVAYLNITVVDELPTLSYSPENLTLIKNQTSTDLPLNATLTGSGTITSWAISPALPSGVSFGTSNGTIWGIATVLQTSPVTYTIWANNTGGSTSATVNITINDEAPSISYTPSELNLTRVTTSSDLPLTPINTGGYTQTTALCSSSGTPKLFVVSDHEGTRHVLCGTTLYSIDLDGTQTVSTNHVTGTGFGLEIDDEGHLHIGHWVYNYPHIEIHHTTNKNGSWQSSEVQNFTIGGSVAYDQQGFSMAVGSDDSIHFTYIRTTSAGNANNLYHLSNQSGSWSSTLLTNTNKPTMPSLALNDDNVPHVAFSAGNSISVGKYENGSYTTLFSRSNYLDPDIAIDAQGDVHVVYRTGSYGLWYSTNASGSWQHAPIDQTKRHIDVRIALDSNDYPHVMSASITGQYNNNYRHVNYYSHDGSSWSGGNITPAISSSQQPRPDIFIDDNDVISMVHHDQNNGNLFTRSGSTTYGYSISPALPSGLTFSQSTGTISGVSTVQMNRTMFTITANNSGGSSTAYINITVNDRMPSFTYNPENLTLTNNTVSSDLPLAPTFHYSGDVPTNWVLIGTLPAGLNFGTNNGTIWGTATELWATTNYTVYGNNTGGSFNVSINITVNDEVPTLSYLPENVTLTRGQSSSDLPLAPTLSGSGVITSWGINATLPNGLFFGPNNGTLYGIATVNMTTTAYTIYANNSGGSASAQINLTVLEPIVELDYNPENLTLVRSDAMTTLHPTVTGGNAETWGIHPPIPAGLNFADGVLSGTPTVNLSTTMFTIYANTTGGSATHTINITILEPIVTLDYNPENLTLVRGIAMTTLHPTITGGSVETWGFHPSIPAGLNFADGVLSGTPTVNMTLTMFTIYANTTGGSASHTINLTILEPGVILDYNPENQTLTRGVAMVTMTPTVTNGSAETWSIDPILPSGLNFNNGVISGTPTVNMTRTTFTVWANTTGGAAFHTVNLTILEPIVGLDYNPENLTLTRDVAMASLHPIVTGGNVSEWGISPIPLSGLTFAEGMLYGTPGANQTTPIMYTIYANTTGGSVTHTINITVLEPVVDLFYNPENQTFIRMEQSIVWSPTVSGGIPETWAVEPALPNGLIFDNGTISGSPTVNLTTTQYIVWANNSGGSASTSINITINEPAPEIEYVPSDLVLTRDTAMTTLQPNVTGGAIASWAIEPAIPNGLSFVDGVISGTPTVIQNQTQYVVWANNSGGSLMTYLNITILDIVPEISYTPENFTLTNDTTAIDVLPVNIGGPALTWSIAPALSEGLEFNETTGHITGTPTEVMDVQTYVITAINTGGSATAQINITVLDQVPMVAYIPNDVTLLNNSTVLTMEAISTGGIVTAWSIMPDPSPGLVFDATNGTLSGVATQVQNRTMYVITASNDVGSINVVVNITIEDLFYNMSLGPLYLLNNSEMIALEPELTINGSTFEIEPDLPEGLFLGTENGTIWGTPTELMDLTNFTIYANSSLFNDAFVVQIGVLEDTDLDGLPNELPGDADPRRGLIEDLDDDGDGFTDLIEGDCLSDPLDGSDVPSDLDGDFVCNAIDDDIDGDGLNNSVETNTSTYVDSNNTGTDPWDADTDGDGICDGPIAPALPVDHCEAGPDAFPNDAAAYLDTDGDGMPDELWGESTTGLIEDLDDDNDGWTDLDEADCGPTDSKNELDIPVDSDGDGICDFNEVLSVTYGSGDFELLQGQQNVSLQPIITGMSVDIWVISPALPYGLIFGGDTMARTSNGNGTVYGIPLIPSNLTEYTVTGTNLLTGTQISTTFNLSIDEDYDLDGLPNNNTRLGLFEVDLDDDGDGFNDSFELECGGDPYNRSSVPKIESDGTCYNYRAYEEAPEQDKNPFKPICFPIIFIVLAFILVVPMILTRRQARVGVRAEHVSGTPAIQSGSGTQSDPFVLKPVVIPYNSKGKTEERIRCAEMSPGYEVNVREINVEINKKRFGAVQFGGIQDGTGVLKSNSDGLLMIQFTFDGKIEPSEFGMVYKSELILDEKTYFVWHVETKAKKGK